VARRGAPPSLSSLEVPRRGERGAADRAREVAVLDDVALRARGALSENHDVREVTRVRDASAIERGGDCRPGLGLGAISRRLIGDRDDARSLDADLSGREHFTARRANDVLGVTRRDAKDAVRRHDERERARALRVDRVSARSSHEREEIFRSHVSIAAHSTTDAQVAPNRPEGQKDQVEITKLPRNCAARRLQMRALRQPAARC